MKGKKAKTKKNYSYFDCITIMLQIMLFPYCCIEALLE